MKIFLLDDSEALGRYISRAIPAGENCGVYCVSSEYYEREQNLNQFFHALLTEEAWRRDSDTQSVGLKSLIGKASEKHVFLIHVNHKRTKSALRQDQEGVELLKHIRLTEELGDYRNSHVVLYSFEEQLQLLNRKPGNLILLSEGVTFFRLPDNLEDMANPEKLANLADKPAHVEWDDFKRFVQCDYQPPDSAHQFSNWWGLRQIIRARRAVRSDSSISMPSIVTDNLGLLVNKKTHFLFGDKDVKTEDELNTSLKASLIKHTRSIQPNSKIVYIDDEAGWGESLGNWLEEDLENISDLIYCPPPPAVWENDQSLKDWVVSTVLKTVDESGSWLVLLDLRLLGNKEIDLRVSDTSGAKIARIIRGLASGLPVILMTASNKAYSYEAALKEGIDGYWMKEGVGEHAPQGGSCKNYVELLLLVSKALGPEYQFLRLFSQKVGNLKNATDPNWWESHLWRDGTTTTADRKTVGKILDGIMILLREYLRLFCMGYGFKGEGGRIEQAWICSLMVESAKLLELVHQLHLYRKCQISLSLNNLLNIRDDQWGLVINDHRNLAAHAQGGGIVLTWKHARCFLSAIMTWLSTKPTEQGGRIRDNGFFIELNGMSVPNFPNTPPPQIWQCPNDLLELSAE